MSANFSFLQNQSLKLKPIVLQFWVFWFEGSINCMIIQCNAMQASDSLDKELCCIVIFMINTFKINVNWLVNLLNNYAIKTINKN